MIQWLETTDNPVYQKATKAQTKRLIEHDNALQKAKKEMDRLREQNKDGYFDEISNKAFMIACNKYRSLLHTIVT